MAAALLLLVGAGPQDQSLRDPWDGFAPGSWVEFAQSNGNRVTHVYRNDLPRELPRLEAPDAGLVPTGRRDDVLVIGGRRLECEVTQYARPDDEPSRWVSLTVWRARGVSLPPRDVWASPKLGLPPDVVKLLRCELRDGQVTSLSLDVVDLDARVVIRGPALASSVEDVYTTICSPDRPTGIRGRRRWVCDAIPGRIARRDEACISGEGGGYYTVAATDFKAVR